MKAGVYLRISKDHDGQGLGVERQREDCLRYVKAKGWQVVACYTDNDVSASKTAARPEFEAMLKAVQAGELQVVVSYHLDRLLRRLVELERVFNICQESGAHIVTVADGVDTSNDGGRLIARILASVAQGEVERKSARQRRAMRQRAEKGIDWGGRAFGYTPSGKLQKKESTAIKRAYQATLQGETLHAIAREWNRRGLTTTRGNPWRGTTVKLVLTNPRYCGLRTYRGEVIGAAQWTPVVDQETWESVNLILNDPERLQKFTCDRSRKFLLTGVLICGACGGKLSVSGKSELRNYACKHMGCYRTSRRVDQLDEIITDVIKARLAAPDAEKIFIKPQGNVHELYQELKTKRKKLESIGIAFAEDNLTAKQAKLATQKIQDQIDQIEAAITAQSRPGLFPAFNANNVAEWFDSLSVERRRDLILTLCHVIIHPVGKGWRNGARNEGIEIIWRGVND